MRNTPFSKEEYKHNFWAKVEKTSSCWIWLASKTKDGYGTYGRSDKKKETRAHRISYIFFYGIIPKGKIICHKCDNPSCVNPTHLFIGTIKDNNTDAINKGRAAYQKGTLPDNSGENNSRAKLTNKIVESIREEYRDKRTLHRILAKRYNVSKSHISSIISRKLWKNVTI